MEQQKAPKDRHILICAAGLKTKPNTKNKHQQGQTRKQRDGGGEKGDKRRIRYNPSKIVIEAAKGVIYATGAVVVVAGTAYVVSQVIGAVVTLVLPIP